MGRNHLCKRIPSPPKIGVCNDANGFAQLLLNVGRARNHQTDELLLDGLDLILGDFVVALLVLSTA